MKYRIIILVLSLFSQLIFSQNREVKGVVKGVSLDTFLLPGASILIEGTKISTQTDFDGNYTITVSPDQFLIFSYVGMHSQKISARENKIDVILVTDEPIEEVIAPDISGRNKKQTAEYLKMMKPISIKDIKNLNNPKYNFKKNYKEGLFVIFIPDMTTLEREDFEFQKEFKAVYATNGNVYNLKYLKTYNKLTFKYLKKKYNKAWESKIRKDAIGLDVF